MFLKKACSIILVIFLSITISAQNYSHEFGVLTDYEKEMTVYEKDSTAEAVVIYDSGKTNFRLIATHFEVIYKRKTKIKVLEESYINQAEFYIPIYDRKGTKLKEKLINIEAYTYNTIGGKMTKTILDKELIYKQKINENYYLLKFAMPNVKVGSIIEMRYELRSPYPVFLKDWEFQNTIPTIFSEQILTMIPFFNYKIILQGASKFDKKNIYEGSQFKEYENLTYRDKTYHFIMKDIPAFKDEAFISSRKAYIIKLDFQLAQYHQYRGSVIEIFSTWEKLIEELLVSNNVFGAYIKKSKYNFKKIADLNNLLIKNEKEKIDYTINYIKQSYNWNGWNNMYTTKSLNSFLKEKTGNSAQFNLYLVGALRAVGIEVYPVIISTRGNGKIIRQYPFLDPFNYVLAYAKINGKWKLLDATDTYCPNDKIPEKCINDIGLIINKDEVKWLKITRHDLALTQNNFKSKLSTDLDTLIGKADIQSNGYSAMRLRKKFEDNIKDIEEYISSDDYEITSPITTENYNDINKEYIINYDLNYLTERINDKIIIHPFFNDPHQDNPLKEKSRKYPIDMVFPKSISYKNEIQIPNNCRIEKFPEETFINNDLFLLQYSANENNGIISLNATYQFKKAIYEPEDYLKIKSYFDLIIKYFNQHIVLVEKPD